MGCWRCDQPAVVGGPYCVHCGALTTRSDDRRRRSFAVQSGEGVFQLAVVTTVMPHANGRTANRYRWALGLGALVVVATTLAGLLPAAVFSGALVVPVAYALYLYDHGIGGEAPGAAWVALLLTGALSVLVSLVFFRWVFDDQFTRLVGSPRRAGLGTLPVGPFLVFVLLMPLVAQIAMNAGAAWLVTRPRLDDMLDGLAFGVMAGTVYAGGESIVAYWSVFTSAQLRTTQGLGTWLPVILGVMVVKALVYGLATGLTVAAFSGRTRSPSPLQPARSSRTGRASGCCLTSTTARGSACCGVSSSSSRSRRTCARRCTPRSSRVRWRA